MRYFRRLPPQLRAFSVAGLLLPLAGIALLVPMLFARSLALPPALADYARIPGLALNLMIIGGGLTTGSQWLYHALPCHRGRAVPIRDVAQPGADRRAAGSLAALRAAADVRRAGGLARLPRRANGHHTRRHRPRDRLSIHWSGQSR
ncbi:MAG TPA: hypothetical protein VF808_14480 [Ktedonobacterales bacterium]